VVEKHENEGSRDGRRIKATHNLRKEISTDMRDKLQADNIIEATTVYELR
jgi:hypothetical protein